MSKRKIRDEAEARKCLADVSASRLSLAEWARAHGVDGRSLNSWRNNLARREGARPALVEWVPSGLARSVEPVPVQPLGPARYTIRCGELSVEVDEHFNADTLRRLLRVVASC